MALQCAKADLNVGKNVIWRIILRPQNFGETGSHGDMDETYLFRLNYVLRLKLSCPFRVFRLRADFWPIFETANTAPCLTSGRFAQDVYWTCLLSAL